MNKRAIAEQVKCLVCRCPSVEVASQYYRSMMIARKYPPSKGTADAGCYLFAEHHISVVRTMGSLAWYVRNLSSV